MLSTPYSLSQGLSLTFPALLPVNDKKMNWKRAGKAWAGGLCQPFCRRELEQRSRRRQKLDLTCRTLWAGRHSSLARYCSAGTSVHISSHAALNSPWQYSLNSVRKMSFMLVHLCWHQLHQQNIPVQGSGGTGSSERVDLASGAPKILLSGSGEGRAVDERQHNYWQWLF